MSKPSATGGGRYKDWSQAIATHLLFAAAIVLEGLFAPPSASWILILITATAYFLAIGYQCTDGYFFGILIDGRNRISLSRAQIVAWTILVLSAFAAAAFANIYRGVANPLSIAVPEELWVVMGISTTSLVGTPLLLGIRQEKPGTVIHKNKETVQARLTDMVKGEDEGDCDHVDLPKLQMGFFTIVLVVAYAAAIGQDFSSVRPDHAIHTLPALDKGMLALMGISHTGYLPVPFWIVAWEAKATSRCGKCRYQQG